jgi:hypothetical protein
MRCTPRARFALRRTLPWLAAAAIGCAAPPAAAQATNSADRMIIWVHCGSVVDLTDAQLDTWKSRGVDGFVCNTERLRGMGGSQSFTGDPNASLAGTEYDLQRRIRDSHIVDRMRTRGMKAYLGFWLVNYWNTATPLKDWFDDAGWRDVVLPRIGDMAAAARTLGFAGVAVDQEMYRQDGGVQTATWNWDYPGNSRTEAVVRAKARERGQELMQRLTASYPNLEVVAYFVALPESWAELFQEVVNGNQGTMSRQVAINLWDGLTSVPGYAALRIYDHYFYKTPSPGTWETALQYNQNRVYAMFSQRLSNWAHASSRIHVSPFGWIDNGPSTSTWDDAKPVDYVAEQLRAFRKWGMGGEFGVYSYNGLAGFNYTPYDAAMREASTPATVDAEAPGLTATRGADPAAGQASFRGTATDNLAIRDVRWSRAGGPSGSARMTWKVNSGDYKTGYKWQMDWVIPSVALVPGENRVTITAEDIKGVTTSQTIVINAGGTEPPPDGCG